MPRVSVIIPTYNRAALLREAIDSVLAQTYADFEIIVVDDGSVDDTAAMLATLTDPRLRYVRQANAGRSAARNQGLALAQGEFICFLDDDDAFLPNKLSDQTADLDRRTEIGLIVGGWRLMDERGRPFQDSPPQPNAGLTLPNWFSDCPFIVHAPLIRRGWLERTSGFDRELEPAEDWGLWLELAHLGCPMAWGTTIVCLYRQHAGNSLRAYTPQMQATVRMLDKYFARPDVTDEARALRPMAYARAHLFRALRWFDLGYPVDGSREFDLALHYRPDWVGSARPELLKLIADSTRNPTLNSRQADLIRQVLVGAPETIRRQPDFADALRNQIDWDDLHMAGAAQQWPVVRAKIEALVQRDIRNLRRWMPRLYLTAWLKQMRTV